MAELRGDLSLDTSDASSSIEALESIFEQVGASFAQALLDALGVLGAIPAPELDTSQIDTALSESATSGAEAIQSSIADAASAGGAAGAEAVQESLAGIDAPTIDVPVDANVEPAVAEIATIDPGQLTLEVEADTTDAQGAIDDLGASAVDASGGMGSLEGATSGFQAAGDLATGSAAGLGASVGQLGAEGAAATAAVVGTAKVLSVFFNEAVDAAGATQQFNNSLGESRARVEGMRDIDGLSLSLGELALTLGSDDDALRQVVARLFQAATASGIADDAASVYVESLAAIGARAVALNPTLGTVDEVVARLSTGLARGGRFAANYGIALTAAEINARALNDTGKVSVDQLTQVEKSMAGAAIASERYGGNLDQIVAEGSKNAIIQQRTLSQAIRETFERLGAPLVVPIFELLRESRPIIEDVGRIFTVLGTSVLPIVVAALMAVEPPLRLVALVLELLGPILPAVLSGFLAYEALTFLPALLTAVATAMSVVGASAGVMAGGALATAAIETDALAASMTGLATTPIGLVLIGVGALVGAYALFSGGSHDATRETKQFTDALVEHQGALSDTARQAALSILEERHQTDDLRRAGLQLGDTLDVVSGSTKQSTGLLRDLNNEMSYGQISASEITKQQNKYIDALRETDPQLATLLARLQRHGELNAGLVQTLLDLSEAQLRANETTKNRSAIGEKDAQTTQEQADATKKAADAWQSYVDTLTSTIPSIDDAYSSAFDTAQTQINTFIENIGKTPAPTIPGPNPEQVLAAFQEAYQATVNYTSNVDTLLAGHFDDIAQLAIDAGPKEGAAIAEMWAHADGGTRDAFERQLEATERQGSDLAARITNDWAPQISDATDEAAARARFAFQQQFGVTVSDTGLIFDRITNDIIGYSPNLADAGKAAGGAATDAYGTAIAPIPNKTAATMGEAQGALAASGVPEAAGQTGGYAAFLFGTGFGKSAPISAAILNDVGSIINQSQTELGSAANIAGLAIGSQLGWGISAGIEPWIRRVEDQLQELIRKAREAADAEARSGSPSKLFMEVGRDIGEGLVLGIESVTPRIIAAPALAITEAAQIGATSVGAAPASTSTTAITFDIDVHGVADPTTARQVGTEIGDAAAAALARRGVIVAARVQRSGR